MQHSGTSLREAIRTLILFDARQTRQRLVARDLLARLGHPGCAARRSQLAPFSSFAVGDFWRHTRSTGSMAYPRHRERVL